MNDGKEESPTSNTRNTLVSKTERRDEVGVVDPVSDGDSFVCYVQTHSSTCLSHGLKSGRLFLRR